MKLKEVTAGVGFVLPHPRYQYASVRVELAVTATLTEEDKNDVAWVAQKLNKWVTHEARRRCEELVVEEAANPTASAFGKKSTQ